jgi:ribosome biogenesis protein ENP2
MAARLLAQQAEAEGLGADADADGSAAPAPKRARKAAAAIGAANPLADERFKAMFEEEDFAIDERSKEYQLLHPNADKVGSPGGLQEAIEGEAAAVGGSGWGVCWAGRWGAGLE